MKLAKTHVYSACDSNFFLQHCVIMDARSASVHVIFYRCFLYFFIIPALVGQTAERIFTKLSHVVDIRHHLRTY